MNAAVLATCRAAERATAAAARQEPPTQRTPGDFT